MRLDLKENIVFPFSDPSWITKTLIGIACQFFVFTSPALVGYQLAIIRQTANGEDEKLPEFNGFGDMWIRGLKVSLVLFALALIPIGVTVGMAVTGVMASGGGDAGGGIGLLFMGLGGLFSITCFLLMALFLPAMMLRFAMTNQLSSFFEFSTIMADIRQGLGDYLMIVFFPIVGTLVMMVVAAITFGLGAILLYPAGVWMMFIQARMIGNYYRAYFM